MEYNPEVVRHGNRAREEAKEHPATFATYNGEADVLPENELVRNNAVRKAGPGGRRALELMTNPVAQKETADWMRLFGKSNQGMEFNQAAMQQSAMGVQQ